jgi:hypothetical protein
MCGTLYSNTPWQGARLATVLPLFLFILDFSLSEQHAIAALRLRGAGRPPAGSASGSEWRPETSRAKGRRGRPAGPAGADAGAGSAFSAAGSTAGSNAGSTAAGSLSESSLGDSDDESRRTSAAAAAGAADSFAAAVAADTGADEVQEAAEREALARWKRQVRAVDLPLQPRQVYGGQLPLPCTYIYIYIDIDIYVCIYYTAVTGPSEQTIEPIFSAHQIC